MAAGQGYIEFATGDVLTAAAANGYLASQVVMVFASSAARTSAITSPQEGMLSYLKDTNAVEAYDGAAWISIGSTGDITGVTAGTGISGGGTSGTVTVTNSMATAIDAKGDLIAGTAADAFSRLAVGTNGQVLTADSAESTGMKWATAAGGSSFAGVRLSASGTQSISNNTNTKVTFNGEVYDVGGYAASGSTITIPSGKAGYYLLQGSYGFLAPNATGYRGIFIKKNTSTTLIQTYMYQLPSDVYLNANVVAYLAVGDTVELYLQQTSGTSLTLTVDTESQFLAATFLGA
jgi:hypothetical protein